MKPLILYIPDELHHAFKQRALDERTSMTALGTKTLQQYLSTPLKTEEPST